MKLKRRSLAAPVPEVGARPSTPPEHDEPAHFQSTPGSVVRPDIRRPVDSSVHPTAIGTERPPPRSSSPAPGKGRKICAKCDAVIGARATICPRCHAALPPRRRSISRLVGPVEPGGVNRKVVSVNELAEHGRARVRVVSGVASNDDDGEERRVVDEDANREEPAAVNSRDDVNDVDDVADEEKEEKDEEEDEDEELAHLDAMVAEAKLRLEEGARTLREKLRSLPAAPARGCARGCAGAWIAFGDECPTRRTFAFSDTAVQPGVQTAQPGAKVPLACYFVKAFDASWLDVNHRPRYAACNSCGGWRDLGENPNAAGGARRIRRIRDDADDERDEHDGFATELDARRAASRARRLTLAGGAHVDADWRADWDAHGGAHGGAHGPYGYACAVATAEELAGAAEEAACRVRSSPSFSTGPIGEQEGRASVEPVDALAVAATALATRESAMRRRSRSPSGESPAFTLDAMAAAAEASGSGEADELTRVLSSRDRSPPPPPPPPAAPTPARRLTFVMRRPAPDANPATTPPNETFVAAPSPATFSRGGDDEAPPPPTTKCGCVPDVPEGWRRWETVRTKPSANGSMAADCYYRSPDVGGGAVVVGRGGGSGSVVLRSEKEIEDFLRSPPAALADACAGLTIDRFWCRPFTRGRCMARGAGRRAREAEAELTAEEVPAAAEAAHPVGGDRKDDEPAADAPRRGFEPGTSHAPTDSTDAVPDVEAMRESVRAQLREELRAQVAAELRAEMMRDMGVPAAPTVAASCAADEDARAEREAWEGKAGMRE